MSTNKVFINYTETYDLNTVKDKLTILGIHTPTKASLLKMAAGLFQNFKAMKIHSCDVALACASQLPMDPLGVGTEPGMVAPQDVMNPILFKPVTGEKLNSIVETAYTGVSDNSLSEKKFANQTNDTSIYYNLLADNSFRKAHPQVGLVANNLVPLVHDIATLRPVSQKATIPASQSYPNAESGGPLMVGTVSYGFGDTYLESLSVGGAYGSKEIPTQFITTGSRPLPTLPTMINFNPTDDNINNIVPVIPKVYCGVIVMPPAVLQSLYYRVQITWHIGFYGFRPSFDFNPVISMLSNDDLYTERYETPVATTTASMMLEDGSLDTMGVENIQIVNASVS